MIDIFIVVMLCISAVLLIFALLMLHRNNYVFKERMKVHGKIFEKGGSGNYIWSDRIFILTGMVDEIATYDQMMHRFWKKPSSFYKDFLDELEREKLRRIGNEGRRSKEIERRREGSEKVVGRN